MDFIAKRTRGERRLGKGVVFVLLLLFALSCLTLSAGATSLTIDLASGEADQAGGVLDVLFLFGLLALLPSLVIMTTSFTRIIIVLSFMRNAMGTQQSPPNQVLIGIALFLSLFVMTPVLSEINTEAYQPYRAGEIAQEEALERAGDPLKQFMLRQTREKEMRLFLELSGQADALDQTQGDDLEALGELGFQVIVPAFMTSELKRAFVFGFYLYIPFLIIDLVVASTLMSMGMVMLPPSMISLPFKIMMFVLVDGWNLLFDSLVRSFR